MKRSRFEIEYNKWLQQVDVGEGNDVWNEIQDELDYIETWDNISARLVEVKPQNSSVIPMKYLKVLAAVAAIILILLLPVRYIVQQANQPDINSELSKEADEKEVITSDDSTPLKAAKDEAEVVQRLVSEDFPANKTDEKSLASFSSNELMPIIGNKDSERKVYSNEEIDLHRIQKLPFHAYNLLVSNHTIQPIPIETEIKTIIDSRKSSGFSFRFVEVGVMYGFKNTWLLNHETRNGLDPEKLGNTLPTFHYDIGLSSSLEVNNRHLFGLEFLWKSKTGQNYQQYINASFLDKNITLDYLKLQAFYIWDNNRFSGQTIVGGYMARLTTAEEQVDEIRLNVDDSYSNLDYGLLAGYQFNLAFKNRFTIKPGIRVNYNLVNIFKGDEITPSYFKRTNNLSASVNISLSYMF